MAHFSTGARRGGSIFNRRYGVHFQPALTAPNPPDWYPEEHPPMPQIVAHGGQRPAGRACAQCHLPSGDGHPESSSLAGLPAAYMA